MGPLALIVCLGFIFYCLYQDRREFPHFSKALWLPFIWLLVCSSKPITMWLNPGLIHARRTEMALVEGNTFERVFFILLIAAGLWVLLKRGRRFTLSFKDNGVLVLFILYILLSVVWAAHPDIVLKRWLRLVGDIVMVLVILSEENQGEAVEHLLRRCAIVLIPLSMVFIRFFGNIGIGYSISGERMWTGVTTNKNELGFLCAYMGIFFVWRIIRSWPRVSFLDILFLLQILYLLRGCRSVTSATVFALGSIILFFFMRLKGNARKIRKLARVSLLLLVLLQGLSIGILEKSLPALFLSLTGKETTFTGRTPLWEGLIEMGAKKPVFGSGYGNFWVTNLKVIWSQYAFHPVQGHNGYIDVFLDLGIVGIVLLLLLVVHTYRKILKAFGPHWPYETLMLVFFIMVLVHNLTEASIAKPTNLLWALFLLSTITVKSVPKTPIGDDLLGPHE